MTRPPPPLQPGSKVRILAVDPLGHSRVPRYLRGQQGQVVELHGSWPVPGRVIAAADHTARRCYAVRFDAAGVFGLGDHVLIADIWETDLEPEGVGS